MELNKKQTFVICHAIKADDTDIKYFSNKENKIYDALTEINYINPLSSNYKDALEFGSLTEAESFLEKIDDKKLSLWKSNLFICAIDKQVQLTRMCA